MNINVLDIVDKINVLARLEILAGALWHRRTPHEIRVSRYGTVSGNGAEDILKKRGVRAWGGRAVSDWFVLYVSREQAKWAESILLTAGCTLERITSGARPLSKLPTPWAEGRRKQQRTQQRKLTTWDKIKAAFDE